MPPLGRPPIPTETKKEMGYRSDRINHNEPKPEGPLGEPPGPLDEVGRATWDRIAHEVEAMRVATSADAEMLYILCRHASIREKAQESIDSKGVVVDAANGGMKANPAVAMVAKADRVILEILGQFGMSPAARTRVAARPEKKESPLDEFEG